MSPLRRSFAVGLAVAGLSTGCADDGPLGPILAPGEVRFGEERVLSTHREIDVLWENRGVTLSGTLLLPSERGSHPAVMAHFGSDRWTRSGYNGFTAVWLERGVAVFSYDKRGVGESGGRCCPFRDRDYFPLLASDLVSGVRAIARLPEIDSDRIGLWGFSQGGWVVPVAAAEAAGEIAFTIIGSGPTVTLGEELLYSELTGDDECRPSGLSETEIDRRLEEEGPSLFDPVPYLRRLENPGLWIFGGADTSIPVKQSVAILEGLRTEGQDVTIMVLPDANHVWIVNGGMCQTTGRPFDWIDSAFEWLESRVSLQP